MRSVIVVKNSDPTPVARHFTLPNHSVKNIEFSIIHWLGCDMNPDATRILIEKELYYIWALPSLTQQASMYLCDSSTPLAS